jgi:hypothetical protein
MIEKMTLQPGQIVKNLIPSEAVTINRVQNLGASVSIAFTGVNTKLYWPQFQVSSFLS